MSAIGDYIHYTKKGYEMHGIDRYGGNGIAYNYANVKNLIRKRMQSTLKKYDVSGLEDGLNYLLGSTDNSEKYTNRNEILNKVEEILEERFGNTLGQIDFNTGDISATQLAASAQSKGVASKAKIQANAAQEGVYLSTIISRIRALESIRDSIDSKEKAATLTKKLNDVYRNLNEAYNGLKRGMIGTFRDDNRLKNIDNKTISIAEGSIGRNLITDINTLLKDYSAIPAINLQKGDLFEYIIALVPAIGKGVAEEELNQTLERLSKTVSGGDRSKVTIDFKNFTNELDYSKLNLSHYIVSGDKQMAISYGTSQGKIDIQLEWNGQIIPVSAKNVNLKSPNDIHILSGASFLALIQDMDPVFVNHYLNVVAQHHSSRGPDAAIDNSPVTGTAQAHEAMKWMLLYKALSGDVYEREAASVFIVNDNSKQNGGVKVFHISDLVEKAMKAIDIYTTITTNGKDLSTMRIDNHWHQGSYSHRITDFLTKLHQEKISASLKSNILDK